VKFLCEQCKAKYQIADEKAVGKTVRMKCRKCGHLIEVRAAVTETSVSSALPRDDRASAPPPALAPPAPPAARPPPPRLKPAPADAGGNALAISKPERVPGALEGAFKTAVQNDSVSMSPARRTTHRENEEGSAPFDMADLSPNDEWYVAINGVPVGPIRVAEVRRKAALGAVTEESLAWQEGLDEWRPLRFFPELAATVRDAMARASRPPPEMRPSVPPPPRTSPRSSPPAGFAPRLAPPRGMLPPPSPPFAARSNVVPFVSRAATAEKFEPVQQDASPLPGPPLSQAKPVVPSVVPDPFASPPAVAPAPVRPSPVSSSPPTTKKSPPWMQLAMVAAAAAFGITAAFIWLSRPSEPAPAPVTWPSPSASASAAAASATAAPTAAPISADTPEPATPTASPAAKAPAAPRATATAAPSPNAAASNPGRSLDLHSLAQSAPAITPTDEPSGDAPKGSSGQSLTEGQVQQVIAAHRTAIGRVCWERNPTSKNAVNVSVLLTVGGDGSAQNVSATGDEGSVAKCIENDVRTWRFPATGSSQRTNFSLKFVRQ